MIPIDLIHNNNQTSYQNKKVEKNDTTPKFKNMKSTDLLKETNKNSYFSKYIEECNRNKLNKKIIIIRYDNQKELNQKIHKLIIILI